MVFDKFLIECFQSTTPAARINAIPNALCRQFERIVCLGKQETLLNFSHIFHCVSGIRIGISGMLGILAMLGMSSASFVSCIILITRAIEFHFTSSMRPRHLIGRKNYFLLQTTSARSDILYQVTRTEVKLIVTN